MASGTLAHVPLRLGRVPIYAERVVRRAHALDVHVVVWTVNDQPTMHALLDAGVDANITDHPDLLREVLISRDQWSGLAPATRRVSGSLRTESASAQY